MSIFVISVIVAGGAIAIGTIATALAQGIALSKAMEGISRQPEATGPITTTLIIGLAFIESLTIYVLVISIIILFANPLAKPFLETEKMKSEVEVIQLEIQKIQLEKDLSKLKSSSEKAVTK